MRVDPNVIGPSTLAITQAISAFNTFLPPLSDVRKHDTTDTEFAADVRLGEIAATALTIGVGAVVTALTGSNVPVLIAALLAGGLVWLYESTLRIVRPLEAV